MKYLIGTAGFSYRDWDGIFYPKAIDKFKYYCSIFDFVEINSTFYTFPEKQFILSLKSKINDKFKISIKANQIFTHEKELNIDELKKFFELVKVLNDNLICILFQFPYSFHYNTENVAKIQKIKDFSNDLNIAIEVRHKSFLNEKFVELLQKLNFIFVNIDQPDISFNMPLTNFSTNNNFSYFRFHGRKTETWFSDNIESYERYNYLYDDNEINILKQEIIKNKSDTVIISFNNHYKAAAVINALQLMQKLDLKPKISFEHILKTLQKNKESLL